MKTVLFVILALTVLLTGCNVDSNEDISLSSDSSNSMVSSASEPFPVARPDDTEPESEPEPEHVTEPEPEPVKKPEEPYTVVAVPSEVETSAAMIAVEITNNTETEVSYGYNYRIEREANGAWEALPLTFDVKEIAILLPAGHTNIEFFDLHPQQYGYTPGLYRIVLLDGLDGATAEFTLFRANETEAEPLYAAMAGQVVYDVTAESITINVTNNGNAVPEFGRTYRIEQEADGVWTSLPLDIVVTDDLMILPAGDTIAVTYSLCQDQFAYTPGIYRIVLTGLWGEPTVEFELE